ncbi:MAG: hypothetical protein H7315_09295 [Herminiimonas sp.]|nr:hypothetical protein [Herminiimonas sp.]
MQAMYRGLLHTAMAVQNVGLQNKTEDVNAADAAAAKVIASYAVVKQTPVTTGMNAAEKALSDELSALDQQTEKYLHEAVGLAQQFITEQAAAIISQKIDPLTVKFEVFLKKLAVLRSDQSVASLDSVNREADA